MAIIRFLDKENHCYQIHTPDTPILIFLSENEKKKVQDSPKGECVMLVDSTLTEEEIATKVAALNTKDDPRMLGQA